MPLSIRLASLSEWVVVGECLRQVSCVTLLVCASVHRHTKNKSTQIASCEGFHILVGVSGNLLQITST
jgi:hypothetical protein